MNRFGEWYVTAVVGAVFGAVLGALYFDLYEMTSLWSGGGRITIGTLFRGPLESIQFSRRMYWPEPLIEGALLYCLQAILLVQATKSRTRQLAGVFFFSLWHVATVAAFVSIGARSGLFIFSGFEVRAWQKFGVHTTIGFTTFVLLLIAWHATVWAILLRGGSLDAVIDDGPKANSARRSAKNVPGR